MGRGHGGYIDYRESYLDSGGRKVTDRGTIFVAERYIDMGYEVVFRQQKAIPTCDLTIKTSDDKNILKNIEVKTAFSKNPSQMAKQIEKARRQIRDGDTLAIFVPHHKCGKAGIDFAQAGVDEARRKGYVKGPIEVWFSDRKKVEL
ncbi:MAG: hypothetical protein IJJ33_13270 [Victivallales bacterium]|nr:hypothetical protein [Victivallales bacterium]